MSEETRTFNLIMTIYTCNIEKGTIIKNIKEVNNCYLYKDSRDLYSIWLANKDPNPTIKPAMVNDNGENIYYLKNWLGEEDTINYSTTGEITYISYITDFAEKQTNKNNIMFYNFLNKIKKNVEKIYDNMKFLGK